MDSSEQGFNAYLFDVLPDLVTSFHALRPVLVYMLEHSRKTPLVADVGLLLILVLDEPVGLFVDCVVGQMHAQVA